MNSKKGSESKKNQKKLQDPKLTQILQQINSASPQKAPRVTGLSFIIMFLLAIFADGFVLQSIIVPGDTLTTINNIQSNRLSFSLGIMGYVVILVLDVIIALALYVILKPVNKNISSLAAVFRMLYTAIMGISLINLVLMNINGYSYGKLIAYAFFISHVFTLGYLVLRSGYIPRSLGVLLIIASFSYIILLYGDFFLPHSLSILSLISMVPATFAEVSLGIWLLLKSGKLQLGERDY